MKKETLTESRCVSCGRAWLGQFFGQDECNDCAGTDTHDCSLAEKGFCKCMDIPRDELETPSSKDHLGQF